eukprot:8397672-Alexandrium_andersonii.AAC.1
MHRLDPAPVPAAGMQLFRCRSCQQYFPCYRSALCFGICAQDPALATADALTCKERVEHYKRKPKPQDGKWAVEEAVLAHFSQAAWP